MLGAVIYFLLILIVILLGILFFPWRIGVRGQAVTVDGQMVFTGAATVGGRAIGLCLSFLPAFQLGIGPYSKTWIKVTLKKSAKRRPPKKPKKIKIKPKKTFAQQLQALDRMPLMKKLVAAVLRKIHWERLTLTGQLGLKNPMTTGLISGMVAWLKTILPTPPTRIDITTHFNGRLNLDLSGDLVFRLQPGVLAITALVVYIRNK
ncbi:MAG: hypothetical protein ABIA75_08120 [Candidatus Neomarinimicrobiota bacterium]